MAELHSQLILNMIAMSNNINWALITMEWTYFLCRAFIVGASTWKGIRRVMQQWSLSLQVWLARPLDKVFFSLAMSYFSEHALGDIAGLMHK
jgi:hypothetical protein